MPKIELKEGKKKKELFFLDENPKNQKVIKQAPIQNPLPLKPKIVKSNITVWEWLLRRNLAKLKKTKKRR